MDACRPTGLNFKPSRIYGYRYAFIRTVQRFDVGSIGWDQDHLLWKVLFLSKLIHPTTAAGCYSARLIISGEELRQIVPGHTQGLGAYSYIVANYWRDWLSGRELETLRDALPAFLSGDAPKRVKQGRRHIDNAFHGFYLDQRVTSIVTGLESLLKVGRSALTRQFVTRVPQLAQMLGEAVTSDEVMNFYDERSGIVHGNAPNWSSLSDSVISQYQLFERLLRFALLRATTDPTFANQFVSDDAVQHALPL